MRTLLIEPTPVGAESLAPTLAHAGHDVVRCHAADGPAFPCAGLTAAGCPLECAGPIDVAVVVHRHAAEEPRASEAGVTCAVRAGIPLVVVGPGEPGPFDDWAGAHTTTGHAGDLDAALDRAIAAFAARRAAPIRVEVERLLEGAGVDAGAVRVEVSRAGDDASIRIRTERELPAGMPGLLATRAHAVDLRGAWPTTKLSVDVGRLA